MTILFSLINKKIHSLSDQVNYIERTGFFSKNGMISLVSICRIHASREVMLQLCLDFEHS